MLKSGNLTHLPKLWNRNDVLGKVDNLSQAVVGFTLHLVILAVGDSKLFWWLITILNLPGLQMKLCEILALN